MREGIKNLLDENDRTMESTRDTQKLIDDYSTGISERLKPKLNELKREGDSKISLASEKREDQSSAKVFVFSVFVIYSYISVTEALSNIKKADAKLISLSNAAVKRKNEFDKWNDTLATKLQNLKDKIAEARNTADGVTIMRCLTWRLI